MEDVIKKSKHFNFQDLRVYCGCTLCVLYVYWLAVISKRLNSFCLLAKFLVPRMNSITSNEFTVKDTFHFPKEMVEQESSLVTGSLGVDSLFLNIPPDEAIDICIDTIYSEQDVIEGINKEVFQNLLSSATKEYYFSLNEVLYEQRDGVAMGSRLGST